MNTTDRFEGIVGQDKAKKKLNFYMDSYEETSLFPNLIFEGPMGSGKTHLCGKVAEGIGKEWLEVNGSTVTKVRDFVERVLFEVVDKEILVFIDEAHAVCPGVFNLLLSILNPTVDHKNILNYEGMELVFDATKISFIFATTERQKIFKPLLTRLTPITLSAYSTSDMGAIIKLNSEYEMATEVAEKLASYCRGTARSAALMGQETTRYCAMKHVDKFKEDSIEGLVDILDLYPLGLTDQEVEVLRLVRGAIDGLSLTALSAKTNNTKEAQQHIEHYLLRQGLIDIDGKRKITGRGINYLKELQGSSQGI